MSTPLSVLIVEDSEDDVLALVRELHRGGYRPTYERVETADAMTAALDQRDWELIISDYKMPHFSAEAALDLIHRTVRDLPFIMVSGVVGEDEAVAAMRAGAHDYIMKGNLARLVPAIERELSEAQRRCQQRRLEEQLLHAQKMECVGRLAGGVAHEFNNFLTPVIGYAHLLMNQLPPENSMRTALAEIERLRQKLSTIGKGWAIPKELIIVARHQ